MQQPLTVDQAIAQAADHYRAGRLADAERICRQVLAADPYHVTALNILGGIAMAVGQLEPAVQIMRRAIAIDPQGAELHNNLGEAYRQMRRGRDAIEAYRSAIALRPSVALYHNNLGIEFAYQGRFGEAIESFRRAIALEPTFAQAYNNLGNVLHDQGLAREAVGAHRKAVELDPKYAVAHSNLLNDLNYADFLTPAEMLEEHRRWWRQHGASIAQARVAKVHPNDRKPHRRLRIGFVSSDFRHHSVAYFLEPLLAARDRNRFEAFAYSNVAHPDEVTARLSALCDGWRTIRGVSDADAAAMIGGDRIDVLIDLSGHTSDSRILLFAHRPAPVQVSFLGYAFSTGAQTIDYRVTDGFADPAGASESHFTEQLLRMPRCAWCYRPPETAPPVQPPPMMKNGHVTFGSFNNFAKVTDGAISAWSEILAAVPNARLVIKTHGLADDVLRQRVAQRFADKGIAESRLTLRGKDVSLVDHLARYGETDIALDTFPYCGTTTTCEALWMGVPVITLAGESHRERVGVSLLSTIGIPEMIAGTPQEYVRIAVALAGDVERLRALRESMRSRLEASPLRDEAGYAHEFEAAIRTAWTNWCAK